jgi:putative tryptophan/tyrosine transport system substrate-binding protein
MGTFLMVVALVLASVLPAVAQEKPLRIGGLFLGPRQVPNWHCGPRDPQSAAPDARADAMDPGVLGFRDELEKLGYAEDRADTRGRPGRRFVLDVRMGNMDAIRRHAQQFVQERVDIILATPTLPVRAAQEATKSTPIPIIFTAVSDPVRDGFVRSLSQPGGHITGITTQLIQGSGKRVEVFKEMVPTLRRVLAIYQADFVVAQQSMVEMRKAAAEAGITLMEKHAKTRAEIQAVLNDVRPDAVDGIIFPVDAALVSNADLVIEKSLEQRLPAFGILDFMADWGALAAYGPSPYQAGRRAAHYLDKIVKGAKPAELPVEPLDPTFVVNLKAAACLGISPPSIVLHQADRVIR